MKKLNLLAVAAASGLMMLLGGCAGAPSSPSVPATGATSPAASPVETATPTPSAEADPPTRKAAALQAIKTAEAAVQGTAFTLDWTRNRWELELIAGSRLHEVYVSADGTSVVRQSSERAEAEDVRLLGRAKVAMAEAIDTALGATPDAALTEADLDSRAGQPVWEIDTMSGAQRQRTFVDAVTGKVR